MNFNGFTNEERRFLAQVFAGLTYRISDEFGRCHDFFHYTPGDPDLYDAVEEALIDCMEQAHAGEAAAILAGWQVRSARLAAQLRGEPTHP